MNLSITTDYALRILIYIGHRPPETCVTVGEIADAYGISKNHLMKVAARLRDGGYIVAVRGNGGGVRLSGDPEILNIGEVVRYTEDDFGLVSCMRDDGHICRIFSACILRVALGKALDAFLGELDRVTLADLLGAKPLLEEIFLSQLSNASASPAALSETTG